MTPPALQGAAKRILSVSTLYPNPHQPRFGAFVARQMAALAARGDWEVTVVNPIGVPPVALGRYKPLVATIGTAVEDEVTVHRPRFTLVPAIGGPFNPRLIARAVLPLAQRLHALAPFDLVDAQFFYPDGPAAARIARELRLPLSIKARGADISLWGGKAYARRQMLAAARQAGGLLAVSEALADQMDDLGFPRDRIAVHYTGLDHAQFRPLGREASRARLRAEFGIELPEQAALFATVGALIPRKGQLLVLRALARLPEAHLAIVGTGPDQAALEAFARDAGMAPRVHFLGSLDHRALPVVLSASEAMVLPSASEGLANAWVEALACGARLVITDIGGAREVLTRAEAGLIVARDPDFIAAGMRQVLEQPVPPEAVAECAAQFSWDANAEALAAYYGKLLQVPSC